MLTVSVTNIPKFINKNGVLNMNKMYNKPINKQINNTYSLAHKLVGGAIANTTNVRSIDKNQIADELRSLVGDNPEVKAAVNFAYNVRTGMKLESQTIQSYERATGCSVIRQQETITADIGDCIIKGRIDGMVVSSTTWDIIYSVLTCSTLCHREVLVEIKNRVNKFSDKLPKNDLLQVNMYMFMTKTRTAHVVEQYLGDIKIHTIDYDADLVGQALSSLRDTIGSYGLLQAGNTID